MKAVVLMSGGLDSTVVLAHALQKKRECLLLSFDYGQNHLIEIESAKAIAAHYALLGYPITHQIIKIDPLIFGHSSLLKNQQGTTLTVPKNRNSDEIKKSETPSTYVPGRNTLFLSIALSQSEIFLASEIYIGANALDTKYPDCSQAFIDSFQKVIESGTKKSEGKNCAKIISPLLFMDKKEIISLGIALNAPLHLSFSCYDPSDLNEACLKCDACTLRQQGFREALFV